MASEILMSLGGALGWVPTVEASLPPPPKPQLLPKDILKHARMLSKDEADKEILNTVGKKNQVSGIPSIINPLAGSTSTPWAFPLPLGQVTSIDQTYTSGGFTTTTATFTT